MKVIRYRKSRGWVSWVIVVVLIGTIVWLILKIRKLQKRLWQAENR